LALKNFHRVQTLQQFHAGSLFHLFVPEKTD
jgi:hypothetical protein